MCAGISVKVLRRLGGLILATIGLVMSLGSATMVVQQDPEVPFWGLAVMFSIGLLAIFGAIALLKRRQDEIPSRNCPKCGAEDPAPAGVVGNGSILYLFAWFLIWFFPLSLLWGASRKHQVRCQACDTLYTIESRSTRIAGIVLWVIIFLLVLSYIGRYVSPP